jgi:hypothetical protein
VIARPATTPNANAANSFTILFSESLQQPVFHRRTAKVLIMPDPTAVRLLIQVDSSLLQTDKLAFQVVEHWLNALDFL